MGRTEKLCRFGTYTVVGYLFVECSIQFTSALLSQEGKWHSVSTPCIWKIGFWSTKPHLEKYILIFRVPQYICPCSPPTLLPNVWKRTTTATSLETSSVLPPSPFTRLNVGTQPTLHSLPRKANPSRGRGTDNLLLVCSCIFSDTSPFSTWQTFA